MQRREMERVEKLQLIRPHNESRVQFRRARYIERTEGMRIVREKLKSDQEEREKRLQCLRNQVPRPFVFFPLAKLHIVLMSIRLLHRLSQVFQTTRRESCSTHLYQSHATQIYHQKAFILFMGTRTNFCSRINVFG